MRCLMIACLCFGMWLNVYCQFTIISNVLELKDAKGKWSFVQYATNILKVTYQPEGYTRNENISDAVLLKPVQWKTALTTAVLLKQMNIAQKGDTLLLGEQKQCALIGAMDSADYRGFRFLLHNGETIYGSGERAIPFNRRGYRLQLYNDPHGFYAMGEETLNYSVPFITSSNHYALFFDNPSKGYLDIGKMDADVLTYGAFSGEINFYLITGKTYPEILQSYWILTGTQPLPPRWALGSFMSRFGYRSDKEVRDTFAKMRSEGVPFDAVIYDLFWFGDSIKGGLGNLDWVNKTAWPNPKKLIGDFREEGVKTILITEPYILEGTKSYEVLKPMLAVDSTGKQYNIPDFYFGTGGLIDIFRNDAKDQFWTYYQRQMDNGVEGWWGDLGEPEKHPPETYHNLRDFGYNRLFSANEVHNIYGHYWTKMLWDKYTQYYPNKRLFSLNRAGYAGTQRYGIFPWSGDVARTWSSLQAQLPIMLGMSMSGIPYIHSDAGGFTGGEKDEELYTRWLQFSAWSPIFRPHAFALYDLDPIGVSFPSEIVLHPEPYRRITKAADVQRYHRLPYIYTLAYNQTVKKEPIVSPLYYYFGGDTAAAAVEDEFMNGPNVLVAPVLQKSATSRTVYLPIQSWWYRWNSTQMIAGGIHTTVNAPLESIPVFVKAGSIIPIVPDSIVLPNTEAYTTADLDWHYYPGTTSTEYTLYDDDGRNAKALDSQQYELIKVKAVPGRNTYTFQFSSNGGNFDGKPATRRFHLFIHGSTVVPTVTASSGVPVQQHMAANGSLEVDFLFTGKLVTIIIQNKPKTGRRSM
jgi:oligosaccharide 4-alpha-D-glucosyltransferase